MKKKEWKKSKGQSFEVKAKVEAETQLRDRVRVGNS
jgi:hypothetical protein